MRYTIKQNNNRYELWINVLNSYSQVFTFDTREEAETAKQEAIAADQERLADVVTINDYFKMEAK
jgi:hypothetical protein